VAIGTGISENKIQIKLHVYAVIVL